MAVHIKGKLCCCVSQICLNCFDIIACIKRCDSEAMTQIMKACVIWNTGSFCYCLKVFYNGASYKIFSKCICKNKVKWIVP